MTVFKIRRASDGAFWSVPSVGFLGHYKGPGSVFASRRRAEISVAEARRALKRGDDVLLVEYELVERAVTAAPRSQRQ